MQIRELIGMRKGKLAAVVAALLFALGIVLTAGPAKAAPCLDCPPGGGDPNDTTAPTVTAVSPADGASNVASTANVTVTFSEEMDPASITASTFKLVREGQTSQVAATLTYESATKTATLNPDADLAQKARYTATVNGGAGGVTDLTGNPLAADHTWTFTVPDTIKPTVALTSPAEGAHVRGTVQIGATASDNVGMSHVALRVQGGAWSEYDYSAPYGMTWDSTQSRDGSVTLQAIAYDTSSNWADDSYSFIVDNTDPVLNVTSGPDGQTFGPGSTQTWTFTASDAIDSTPSVQCKVEVNGSPAAYGPCSGSSSSHSVSNLPAGSHKFYVRATDDAGNVTPEQTRSFSIVATPPPDTTAPTGTVRINGGRASTKKLMVTLNLSASDARSGVPLMRISNRAGALASAPWQPFVTSKRWRLLAGGKTKTVFVQYRDGAGNVSGVVLDRIKYRKR